MDATAQPAAACAMGYDGVYNARSSEDCLYLNVYTKNVRPHRPAPVMVLMHGGYFMMGSTDEMTHGVDFLMRKSVVVVTITYRLGALGFLSVADRRFDIRGNAGLKDQSLGIRWVKENIEAFGGNPQNITLFGGSAGGASVHYHMMSEYSRGLFQKAIIQSGNAFSPFAQRPKNMDFAAILARNLGWNGEGGVDGMMAVVLAADARSIVMCQGQLELDENQKGKMYGFVPGIEPYTDGGSAECFMPQDPIEMAKTAWGNAIPLLTGCNTHEAYFYYKEWMKVPNQFQMERVFVNPIPCAARERMSEAERLDWADRIQKFYYGTTEPSIDNIEPFVDLGTDRCFWYPTLRYMRVREAQEGSGVHYLYRFCFDSPLNDFTVMKMMFCGKWVEGTLALLHLGHSPLIVCLVSRYHSRRGDDVLVPAGPHQLLIARKQSRDESYRQFCKLYIIYQCLKLSTFQTGPIFR